MREDRAPARIYHPWRTLRTDWPHVELEHTDNLPDGRLADTNGVDEIRMRRRLLQVSGVARSRTSSSTSSTATATPAPPRSRPP